MKYWNKTREVRLRCWTKISLSKITYGNRELDLWTTLDEYDDCKRLLQLNPSDGKFFMQLLSKDIWFERGADATWFCLKHSEYFDKNFLSKPF